MNAREKDFDGSARVGADLVDVTAYYGKLKLLFGLVGTAALLTFAVALVLGCALFLRWQRN